MRVRFALLGVLAACHAPSAGPRAALAPRAETRTQVADASPPDEEYDEYTENARYRARADQALALYFASPSRVDEAKAIVARIADDMMVTHRREVNRLLLEAEEIRHRACPPEPTRQEEAECGKSGASNRVDQAERVRKVVRFGTEQFRQYGSIASVSGRFRARLAAGGAFLEDARGVLKDWKSGRWQRWTAGEFLSGASDYDVSAPRVLSVWNTQKGDTFSFPVEVGARMAVLTASKDRLVLYHVNESRETEELRVIDLSTHRELRRFAICSPPNCAPHERSVSATPDGEIVASADARTFHFWDVSTGKELLASAQIIQTLLLSPAAPVAFVVRSGYLERIDLKAKKVTARVSLKAFPNCDDPEPRSGKGELRVTQDGAHLLYIGAKVWVLDSATLAQTFHLNRPHEERGCPFQPLLTRWTGQFELAWGGGSQGYLLDVKEHPPRLLSTSEATAIMNEESVQTSGRDFAYASSVCGVGQIDVPIEICPKGE